MEPKNSINFIKTIATTQLKDQQVLDLLRYHSFQMAPQIEEGAYNSISVAEKLAP